MKMLKTFCLKHKVMPHGPVEKCDLQKALEPFARKSRRAACGMRALDQSDPIQLANHAVCASLARRIHDTCKVATCEK